ncbi:amino acid adenylation domain-containing protein [bacterium]|nr:amino acid adenylation domain-containing protein [bacterium]MDY3022579.1 amino acid adenylation domain-containing protein [Oliverpabstia sp.]MDY3999630.1 amino acid adenylation domain-containing protein [Blautia sp.]
MSEKYYMSSIQKRLYVVCSMKIDDVSYNTPKIFKIDGKVDIGKLQRAFEKLARRYELLRTTFENDGENFYQVVHEEIYCHVEEYKFDQDIPAIVSGFVRPFDLNKAPLMRIGVVHILDMDYLLLDFHHIICDAASVVVYLNDLIKLYNGEEMPPVGLQYKDYAMWQLSKDMKAAESFWQKEINDIPERVELHTDYLRPIERSSHGKTYYDFSNVLYTARVKALCEQYDLSEFSVFLAGFLSFLAKCVSQKQITVGIPMANRMIEETFDMPGMFVNTVVLTCDVSLEKSFADFAIDIQDKLYQVLEYQDYPFENLVEHLKVNSDPSRNPVFDVMFVYENGNDEPFFETDDFSLIEIKDFGYNQSKFDLTFSIYAGNDSYDISWEYCTDLFKESSIKYLHRIFTTYFGNLLNNYGDPMGMCKLLDVKEEKLVFEKITRKPRQVLEKSLLEEFQKNVERTPDNVALVDGDQQLTFSELDELSSRMANMLREKLVKKNSVIAMLYNRSLDTIISIIGIHKAGAAFLPIEPSLPTERINYILANSKAEYLITNIDRKENFVCETLVYADLKLQFEKCSVSCPQIRESENDLVYIIYTSGSTGNPKGVAINEKSLLNYLDWAVVNYIRDKEDCFGFYSPLSFDLTMTSIFLPLLTGLTMHIYYASDYASSLLDLIEDNRVTILKLTPSHMKMINQMDIKNTRIHTFIVGGEELTAQTAKETEDKIRHKVFIINEYGPTEATIGCCVHQFDSETDAINVSIGKPIANTQLYILDTQRNILPFGMTGELYIAGDGLAVGYYNNQAMTKEKFIENPFEKGELMYATGDLAYKNFDGNYTYCGRKDTQTKLRGFRIELEEVEKVALRETEASAVCVTIQKNTESEYLCAYLVGGITDTNKIKEKMRKFLPDYMVPTFFIPLETMPLTTNGKVDKKCLPVPDINSTRNYIAPRSDREKSILEVFSDVLGMQVGLGDYFFEVGGDSIKAMRIVSKLKEMGYKIPVRAIMSKMDMQQVISSVEDIVTGNIQYQSIEGEIKNSIIQKRFWHSHLNCPEHFNQSIFLEVDSRISADSIADCLQKIVEIHDMLRAKFPENVPVIRKQDEKQLFELQEFYYFNVKDSDRKKKLILEKTDELNKSLDLANGPLLKSIFFGFNDKHYLYITIHHLIVDSVSWSILLDDLNGFCENKQLNQNTYMPVRSASYAEWNKRIESLADMQEVQREADYWNKVEQYILRNISQFRYLRTDKIKCIPILFECNLTRALLAKAVTAYSMEVKDIVITALLRAMAQTYGNENQVISMESHGRQNDYVELDIGRTVGWFTSFYPVLFENIGTDMQLDLVNVKETMLCVPNNGSDYFPLKNSKLLNEPDYLHPLVNFNYQGAAVNKNEVFYFTQVWEEYAIPMAAENIFGSPISLDGMVINNRFEVIFSYVESLSDKLKIYELIERFRKELKGIVEYCVSKTEPVVTPMELGCPGMSWNDFLYVQEFANNESLHIKSIYPLTPLQEGILFESINNSNDGYIIQALFDFSDILQVSRLRKAIEKLFSIHEVLRTRILYDGLEQPYQIVVEENNIDFQYFDCRKTTEKYYLELIAQDKKDGISFGKDPLIRFKLFHMKNRQFLLLMTYHHIIIDGWSTGVMLKDLTNIYNNIHCNIKPIGEGSYRKYVHKYGKGNNSVDLNYWKELLGDFSGANCINYGFLVDKNKRNEIIEWHISESLFNRVKQCMTEYNISVNTLVEYIWGRVLQSYQGSNDAVFGKVISGRETVSEADNVVGLYINTIPVRVKSIHGNTIKEALQNLQIQGINSLEHGMCSLAEIQKQTEYKDKLIRTIIVFENFYIAQEDSTNKIDFMSALRKVKEDNNYDITLTAEVTDTLHFDIMYDEEKYSKSDIEVVKDRFNALLEQLCSRAILLENDLELLSPQEKEVILGTFNDTKLNCKEMVFWDRFITVVENFSNNIALECCDEKITYQELYEKSCAVAANLIRIGVCKNDIVALEMNNSIETIIAILGIWRIGAGYVPIDPDYPVTRKDEIKSDCHSCITITNIADELLDGKVYINELMVEGMKSDYYETAPENIAYVLYTSGTTGKPKGIMVTQKNVCSYIESFNAEFSTNTETKILQQGTYTFDVFVEEVFPTLSTGGTVVVYPKKGGFDFEDLCNYMNDHNVTIISCSPLVLNEINQLNVTPNIKVYISGGDELKDTHYSNLIGHSSVYNTYGPTEATVCATYYRVCPEDKVIIPIGKPITNVMVYIMNENGLCGFNSRGEICIGGYGVTDGYINNQALTDEKFVMNPYGEGRIYKTGDIGRWCENGNIIFDGRIDNQIKIRGYRVELGEIEAAVKQELEVSEAAALLREVKGEKVICLYVQGSDVGKETIYEKLSKRLPIYLVPSRIKIMDKLPIKSNGKIDMDKLEIPEVIKNIDGDQDYEKLSTDEKKMIDSFVKVLDQEVAFNDDFFELGGHSLIAARLLNEVEKNFGVRLKISDIFKERTPKKIYEKVKSIETKKQAGFDDLVEEIF